MGLCVLCVYCVCVETARELFDAKDSLTVDSPCHSRPCGLKRAQLISEGAREACDQGSYDRHLAGPR